MLSFHNVRKVEITEPRNNLDGFTNELKIHTKEHVATIDLYAKDKHSLKVSDNQLKTLKSILMDLVEPEPVQEN